MITMLANELNQDLTCPICTGTGIDPIEVTCPSCSGDKAINEVQGNELNQRICPEGGGNVIIDVECGRCEGETYVNL